MPNDDERTRIRYVKTEKLRVVDELRQALRCHDGIFQRGEHLVKIVTPLDSSPMISDVSAEMLAAELDTLVDMFTMVRKSGELREQSTAVSKALAVLLQESKCWPVPHLRGVSSLPVLRSDGSLHDEEGFDRRTGLYLTRLVPGISIPAEANRQEALEALALLEDLVQDFPFADDAARAVWVGAFLTQLVSSLVGTRPMVAIDGNKRGAGKSLLVELITLIIDGFIITPNIFSSDEAEMSKVLTALCMRGQSVIDFDNTRGRIENKALESLVTSGKYSSRILGGNEMLKDAQWTPLIFWTANNLQLQGDMPRRTIRCAIKTELEKPELRSNFKYPDIKKHALQNRVKYMNAGFTILSAFLRAGKPDQGISFGSFEKWAVVIPSCLKWLDRPDITLTAQQFEDGPASESSKLKAVMGAWVDAFGPAAIRAGTLREKLVLMPRSPALTALAAAFEEGYGDRAVKDASFLSYWFRSVRGSVVDGMRFEGVPDRKSTMEWRVERVDGEPIPLTSLQDDLEIN